MWVAPRDIRTRLVEAIWEEVRRHRKHGDGRLIFKMNSLVDRETIQALYAASREGVEIDLIVRGICCLRPGIKGVSDTIRVVSLVGRFLEHTRVLYFRWGPGSDDEALYLSSADLKGQITVINVFASWCAPCQVEHPMLMRLAREPGIRLVGIDYKEPDPAAGQRFLARHGVPFSAVGADADGRAAHVELEQPQPWASIE